MRALADHLGEDSAKGPAASLAPFQAQALALRGHCAEIVNTMTQPIPFPYYHTLTLMLSLNLLLIAYSMIEFEVRGSRGLEPRLLPIPCRLATQLSAHTHSLAGSVWGLICVICVICAIHALTVSCGCEQTIMTIPCFFIIVLVCLGLKETAVALADPFGGDDVSRALSPPRLSPNIALMLISASLLPGRPALSTSPSATCMWRRSILRQRFIWPTCWPTRKR